MQAKPYPEAKRRILVEFVKHDGNAFLKFFDEITGTERKQSLQQILPTLKKGGFRKLDMQIKEQARLLAQKLTWEKEIENSSSQAWENFGKIWILWIESKPQLNQILQEVDNTVDFDENHMCITPPNSELDILCFRTLLEKKRNNQIDQETIQRFYEYGYFNKDERIEDLINQTPSLKEIEKNQRLEGLTEEIDELSRTVGELSQTVTDLNLLFSTKESTKKLEQRLVQRIVKVSQSFDPHLKKLKQKIEKMNKSLNTLLSKTEPDFTQIIASSQSISTLETRLFGLEKSVKSLGTKPATTKPANDMKQKVAQSVKQQIPDIIKQIDPQISNKIKPFENRFVAMEKVITQIKSKTTGGPKISTQALKIGERHKNTLIKKKERYDGEEDYLADFCYCLRRFGVSDSEEVAKAIHIALKAFPAVEITDARIIKIWRLMCDDHFNLTTVNVEMGWLGLQDWFPDLFAEECFNEKLERSDLEISIKKMLELGNMPWVIYLRDCDRSFPDGYLPRFLNWIDELCKGGIKVFLIRSFRTNRCTTNEDFYAQVARLPKPKDPEPIESRNLRPSGIPLTLSEWRSWCLPNPDTNSQYDIYYDFLEELRSVVENRGWQIPIELLREVQHYLRLSHNIIARTPALDWALTLRLLPWLGNRHRLIDIVQNLVNESYQELPHFQEGLQVAREVSE